MSIIQAIILGVIQGFTEFLPISSSAHLYLLPYFFNWDYQGLGFDVALHWGTLLAVLLIFGKDYWFFLKALLRPLLPLRGILPSLAPTQRAGPGEEGKRRMAWFLILGTIPAAAVGFFLEDAAQTVFRSPYVIVATVALFAFLLWRADRTPSSSPPIPSTSLGAGGEVLLNWKKVLFIGIAQAVAIVPGVSRSGATMTAGLFAKLSRQEAARFSFLLAGPIIFGAGLVALRDLSVVNVPLIAGFIASAISGLLAIKFLLRYLTANNFKIFVLYRYVLAGIILLSIIF